MTARGATTQVLAIVAACSAAAAVLAPPFDRLADASFAWHMGQHLVLLFIVPLFVLLARPFEAFFAIAGKRRAGAVVRAVRPFHCIVHPVVTLALFTGYLWGMHFSPLYESALEHPLVHVAEHIGLLVTGTLFWLPVVSPAPLRPLNFPARLLYLLLALPQGALLGFALSAARAPLYAHYAAVASPQAALADQSNGAAVMWVGGGLVIFSAFMVTLGLWARRESIADWLGGEVA